MQSLTLLQNKIKRNPKAYVAEFRQQLRSYEAQLSIFGLAPPSDTRDFGQLVSFLSQVAYLYPNDSGEFASSVLGLLDKNYEAMNPELRRTLLQALQLLRNRGQVEALGLISVCFNLFRCQDKNLRDLLYAHIVGDVRLINKTSTNNSLNKAIQNTVYSMLEEPNSLAAKKSLQVMVELYKRRVWTDTRTVNVIAQACLSSQPKNVAIALQFFLGIDDKIDALEEEEEADLIKESLEASTGKTKEKVERGAQKSAKMYSRKTRSRMRKKRAEEKALKKARRAWQQNSAPASAEEKRQSAVRFPAIELLNDPYGFSEKLFKKLKGSGDHFEVRLLMMNLISRVVGLHKLHLLPFYSFMQKYVQPHQRHVTNILAYLIQACHDLVPPEDVEPILKHLANNFVNDRSGPEVMAVGLNAIRAMVEKIPLLTNCQGMDDLLQDLIMYRRFRRDRSVIIAARGLLNLIREINPQVLQKKERGKFHNSVKLKEYGESDAAMGVDGAELLQMLEEQAAQLAQSSDDEEEEEEEEDDDDDANDGRKRPLIDKDQEMNETLLEKQKRRKIDQKDRIDAQRLLSDQDFRRIKKLKQKLEKEKRDPRARRKKKKADAAAARPSNALVARLQKEGMVFQGLEEEQGEENSSEESDPFDSSSQDDDDDSDDEQHVNDGSVNPSSLEGVVRRRRRELADRLEMVYQGRTEKKDDKARAGGTSNQAKAKNKNFLMVKASKQVKLKQNTSLRHQQMALKRHIKTMEKTKKVVTRARRKASIRK